MATRQNFLLFDSSTDANFRSWGSGISAALQASGWTQTTDTGQINWATVTSPAVSTYAGYEVYKMTDANQAACPIFMLFEYGNNASATKGPAIRITVGTGSTGVGVITGNSTGTILLISQASSLAGQGATTFECNFSSSAGRFNMMLFRTLTSPAAHVYFSVERSLDSSGNYTATLFVVFACVSVSGGSNEWTIMAQGTGSVFTANNNTNTISSGSVCSVIPGASTTGSTFSSNTAFLPTFPLRGLIDNPLLSTGLVLINDQVEAAVFAISMYGASHSYLYSKQNNFTRFGNANMGIAMRWE